VKKIFLIITLLIAGIFVNNSFAQFTISNAFPNLTFNRTTEMIPANDGTNRIFVVTQNGIIYVFQNSPSVSTAKVFLDISDRVTQNGSETGLLGLAFHPGYTNNRYFFVDYTTSALPLRSIVSRFTTSPTNPDSALKSSEYNILTLNQPYSNHNGGKIAFGMEGCLYIALGDGGSEGDPLHYGQNLTVLFSKILRINIDSAANGNNYSIPINNPYYGNNQGFRPETWAWGLRNPWRFSFDPPTGRLWCGDVGQNTYEEIDVIQAGHNYGWSIMEGFHCYNPSINCDTTGLTLPLFEYIHLSGNCSITGGYVYRGTDMPYLVGKYIYGDYCTGRIWALSYDGVNVSNEYLLNSGFSVSTFGLDANNALYVCAYQGAGAIYKITGAPIGIKKNSNTIKDYRLDQNYPNPFNPTTIITFAVPRESYVTLKIYNYLGQEINTLFNDIRQQGEYKISWYANNSPSGVYFYKLTTRDTKSGEIKTFGKKMVLIK
jgi:glucose/arabinose dehydrogenase